MRKQKHCLTCGGSVKRKNIKGATFPWKDFPVVGLCFDVFLMVCENCGEFSVRRSETEALDKALEDSIKQKTADNLRLLMKKLNLNQKGLAEKVGITPVYLSELIRGKKTPSFNFYKLIEIYSFQPDLMDKSDSLNRGQQQHLLPGQFKKLEQKFNYTHSSEIRKLVEKTDFQGMAAV